MSELISKVVAKYRPLKPLPGEITPAMVRDATLPVKVESMRRAIASCTDLSVLLDYKSRAEGLAAAVKIMREAPETIRNINLMLADTWIQGGKLLKLYNGVNSVRGRSATISERGRIIKELGLHRIDAARMVRVAEAPPSLIAELVQKNQSLKRVADSSPKTAYGKKFGSNKYSDAMASIMGTGISNRLATATSLLRLVPLDRFAELTLDERKIVKAKVTECMELLDEMDRRLKL